MTFDVINCIKTCQREQLNKFLQLFGNKPIGTHTVLAESLSGTRKPQRNQQLFLGIVAKDGINLQNPPAIRKPQEPRYELTIEGETITQIRDHNLRNQEKRVAW